MLNKETVLVGYSGHGLMVGDVALSSGLELSYYSDLKQNMNNIFNLEYLGFEGNEDYKHWEKQYSYILGIGNNKIREKTGQLLSKKQQNILTVTHQSSSISKFARIGRGCFVSRNVSINVMTAIEDFCILNTGCIVEHECIIKQSAHIAPGAVLAGNVKIGQRTFVGANSVIKQGVTIGNDVIIGAGAVVINDVPDNQTVVGNPAKQKNE